MNLEWSVRGEFNFVVDKTGFMWACHELRDSALPSYICPWQYIFIGKYEKKLKIKRITQSSMNFKCQVALMKVVTYQFISKSPAEVN